MLVIYVSTVKNLQDNLKRILKAIHQLITDDLSKDIPMLSLTLKLLQSIPGVGLLTAATIIAEIGDFSAFSKPNKLVAFFGVDLLLNNLVNLLVLRIKCLREALYYLGEYFLL